MALFDDGGALRRPYRDQGRQWTLSLLAAIVLICAFGLVLAVTPPRCPETTGRLHTPSRSQQVQLARPGDGLGAVGRAELAQDMADMFLDGVEGDHELAGDGLV